MFELAPKINDFLVILFSIVVEGIPFILIGAMLSAMMECWLTPAKIAKTIPKNKILQFGMMGFLGNLVPVCECGNIPFARRMILKKVAPYLALTFLLVAPVFNPIVVAATVAAFPNDLSVVLLRVGFSLLIAISVGVVFSFLPREVVLKKNIEDIDHAGHDHQHGEDCGDGHCHDHHHESTAGWRGIFAVVRKEFLEMTGIFLFGAVIATTIQLFLPKDIVFAFNGQQWASILAMMLLAFVVSICSNVDAFFALAYAQVFPMSSILAFLVLGPMIDIKAIPMFKTIFTWKAVALIVAFVSTLTFLLSYLMFLFY